MPYSTSKIYKLQCDDGRYYIGSTCNEIRVRLSAHKKDSYLDTRLYSHIRTIGWEHVKLIVLEEFSCENRDQLRQREDEYLTKHLHDELCLNTNRAHLTDEDKQKYSRQRIRQAQTTDKYKAYQKAYYIKTREARKEQSRLLQEARKGRRGGVFEEVI